MYQTYLRTLQDNIQYQSRRPQGILNASLAYKQHSVSFSKMDFANVTLNSQFIKISNDLQYYKGRFQQDFDVVKKMLTAFNGGIYSHFFQIVRKFQTPLIARLSHAEIEQTPLFKFAEEKSEQNEDLKRCGWDELVCSPTDDKDEIGQKIQGMCYFTGQKFYEETQRVFAAIDQYKAAYQELTDSLQTYARKWEVLDENYFK